MNIQLHNLENPAEQLTSSTPQTVDEVLDKCIGKFGKWQFRISLLMSLLKFPIAWFQLGIVFLAPTTKFWCKRSSEYANITVSDWLDMITPNNSQQEVEHDSCYMKNISLVPTFYDTNSESSLIPCQWGYEYDRSIVKTSIVTEWDLICGREHLVDVAQATLMFGVLLGTITLGIASDRYGRKPVLLISMAVQSIAGAATALAPNYTLFILARFVTAFANAGTLVTSFVICMEIVGGKWRTIVPIFYQIPFGIGNSVMAGIAYYLRDWRTLQFTLSILSVLYLFYWYWLPETPRWLIATGRHEEAATILEFAAQENKIPYEPVVVLLNALSSKSNEIKSKSNFSSLFHAPMMRKRMVILCMHWFLSGISFYGFSQYMGQVSVHLHLTIALGGMIAIPGTIFSSSIARKYGRKLSIIGAHVFTAICYIGILAIPVGVYSGDWPRIGMAALGVVGMSVSIPVLYLFTGELFPTVIRNAGVGATVMCSRIGSMIAPFIISLSTIASWLPLLILGAIVFLEALLVLPLPETNKTTLPDSIQEVELFSGKQIELNEQNVKKSTNN